MPLVGIGTPPNPPPAGQCAPAPLFRGGGEHSLARKGLGQSQFRRGAYTVVLFICTYFVMQNINSSYSRRMRLKLPNQTEPACCVVTKINLLVLDDVEHELLVQQADEMEATKPNQTYVQQPNPTYLCWMMQNMNSSYSRRMRGSYQTKPTCGNQNQPTCAR